MRGAGITEWPLMRGSSLPRASSPAERQWHVWMVDAPRVTPPTPKRYRMAPAQRHRTLKRSGREGTVRSEREPCLVLSAARAARGIGRALRVITPLQALRWGIGRRAVPAVPHCPRWGGGGQDSGGTWSRWRGAGPPLFRQSTPEFPIEPPNGDRARRTRTPYAPAP